MAFMVPSAEAQQTGWAPHEVWPIESDREVVLTFWKSEPGRIVYWTTDGVCGTSMPWVNDVRPPETSCEPGAARAPEDYGAVRGEMIFTGPGSRQITISLVDDDRDEARYEGFVLRASEGDDVAEQTTWEAAIVRIVDDDGTEDDPDAPPVGGVTATTSGPARPAGRTSVPTQTRGVSAVGEVSPPPTAPAPAAVAVTAEIASTDLRRGAGFELTGQALPAPAERAGRGRSTSLPLVLGLGAVSSIGVAAWTRWRRRWSPTRV